MNDGNTVDHKGIAGTNQSKDCRSDAARRYHWSEPDTQLYGFGEPL